MGYLEKSNKQLTEETRQSKLDYDSLVREKNKLEVRIHDLEAQIETLAVKEDRGRKLNE